MGERRSGRLSAWAIDPARYPATGPAEARLRFLLGYAVLAPSGHNAQPWRFRLSGDRVELLADRSRALPVVDPHDRELVISCGCALGHLRVALRAFGHAGEVETLPEPGRPDLLARVRLGPPAPASEEDRALLRAIPRRHTNRRAFAPHPLPPAVVARVERAVAGEGCRLALLADRDATTRAADLIAEADRVQMADPAFRRELASWVSPSSGGRRDGVPGYALGIPGPLSRLAPAMLRALDTGRRQAARDRALAAGSPLLAVLGTGADAPADWLAAGQAASRMTLVLRAEGAWTAFLNSPIEVPELRPRLAAIAAGGVPQLLVRIGYGPPARPTPRRPLDDVVG